MNCDNENFRVFFARRVYIFGFFNSLSIIKRLLEVARMISVDLINLYWTYSHSRQRVSKTFFSHFVLAFSRLPWQPWNLKLFFILDDINKLSALSSIWIFVLLILLFLNKESDCHISECKFIQLLQYQSTKVILRFRNQLSSCDRGRIFLLSNRKNIYPILERTSWIFF